MKSPRDMFFSIPIIPHIFQFQSPRDISIPIIAIYCNDMSILLLQLYTPMFHPHMIFISHVRIPKFSQLRRNFPFPCRCKDFPEVLAEQPQAPICSRFPWGRGFFCHGMGFIWNSWDHNTLTNGIHSHVFMMVVKNKQHFHLVLVSIRIMVITSIHKLIHSDFFKGKRLA